MKKTMLLAMTAMLAMSITACSTGPINKTGSNGASGSPSTGGTGNSDTASGSAGATGGTDAASGHKEVIGPPSATEKKTVVFSTFFPSDYFKEAKKKYEAKHPNITIELKSIPTDDAHLEDNLEKFVKTTGTEMLSGQGPDLLEMDQLPSGDYVKKKMLANLGDIMDGDPGFKQEQYFTNILNGMKTNGGLYGLPIGFFIYGLVGNEDLIKKSGVTFDDTKWGWDDFITAAKAIVQHSGKNNLYALGQIPPEFMVNQWVNQRYSAFINQEQGTAHFDSSEFKAVLQQVKTLYDEKVVGENPSLPIFYTTQINSPSDYIQELRQSEFISGGNAYTSKLYLGPSSDPRHPGGSFRTYQTIGLNARSAVKPEAWDFLKFLLSDEMQVKPDGAGFPLNKASYAKKVQELLQKGSVLSYQPIGPMKGKSFPITQKDIDDLSKFLNSASYPLQFKPSKVDDMITEESKAFFTGQKSADDVAKLIQNRVTTYLNE